MSDPSKLKITQLKELLHKWNLPTSGNKAELIARLQMADPDGQWENKVDNRRETTAAGKDLDDGDASTMPLIPGSTSNKTTHDPARKIEMLRREQRLLERAASRRER